MRRLWDPNNPAYREDPYAMYAQLRTESPIHRSQSGDLVLTRHADIKNILLNSKDFRSGNRLEWISRQVKYLENKEEDLHAVTDAMNSFIVMMNPPEHAQLRTILMDAWDDHEVDHIIAENINELLGHVQGVPFDAVNAFAAPLPVMTMTKIMGLPVNDYLELKRLASGTLRSLDMYLSFKQLVTIDQSAKEFIAYLNHFLDFREAHISTDLISKIILQYKTRNLQLERKKLVSICMFLFMAGEETTVNLISTGLLSLLKHPRQRNSVLSNPTLLDAAIDEALRFEAPVQLVGRIANKDMMINGIEIKKEDTLTLCIGAANRDPGVFQEPDQFDITRNAKSHLGFGAGIHFCLGSWLAKKQWKMAIHSILTRFPSLALDELPVWNDMLSVRGIASMKLNY